MDTGTFAGIDIGFVCTGVVIVRVSDRGRKPQVSESAAIRTEPSGHKRGLRVADDDVIRCQELSSHLRQILAHYTSLVGVVAELPHAGAKGARAARAMGMGIGVVAAVLHERGLPVEWVDPSDVKLAATGKRDGTKSDVLAAVQRIFDFLGPLPKRKDERKAVYDAAGALLAGSFASNLPIRMAGLRGVVPRPA